MLQPVAFGITGQLVMGDLKFKEDGSGSRLVFDYPEADKEAAIVAREGGIDPALASRLVALAAKIRNIREHGLTEGASTRLLIYAAQLIHGGIAPARACRTAICQPLTDDERLLETLEELISDIF